MAEKGGLMMAEQDKVSGEDFSPPQVKPHPKPAFGPPQSLNEAIRQELWYVDTVVATPFRMLRRVMDPERSKWAKGLDEAVWAVEGMARLPVKLLQAAFGEPPSPPGNNGEKPKSSS